MVTKIFSKGYDRLPANDVRVTSCSAVFGPKKDFAGRAVRPTALKIQKNVRDIKYVEWLGLQNCCLEILIFWIFDPKNKTKMNVFQKNPKSFSICKKRNVCHSPYQFLSTYQILDRYLFFGQVIAKKL